MVADAKQTCLAELPKLFEHTELATGDVDALTREMPPVFFAQGDVVCREGEPADRAYFVVAGRLRASIQAGGHAETVNEIGAGEVTGESALFVPPGRRSATLTAAEPTVCLGLTRTMLRAAGHLPAVAALEVRLLRLLAARVARTDDLVVSAWREAAGSRPELRRKLGPALGGAA